MQIRNLYEPFEIEYVETSECPITGHKHNFFELVYIIDGTGVQCINKNKWTYGPEKLFLLMPQDCHSFEVERATRFFFIRFNDVYLKEQGKEWLRKLEFIFQNHNRLPGCILKNKADKPLVKSLVEALIREYVNQQPYQRELCQQIVNTLLTVVARNVSLASTELPKNTESKDQSILGYIHKNIYTPELLKTDEMAAQFNISPNYIGEYFKKLTGESLQQYIINYKLKLVETRLQYSDMRMNEIAFELSFTDESHLNRLFKKYKGLSPSEFRRQKTALTAG
ncbi:AraC family transcriptional regulator [Emticicia sp. TH156]|uniref:AraC family transcriptional regulator n=1 Tax=Emticicia sp. TH156 TaxID=2067454 RepID=UPI000C778403|nr:AraC family transcriptional regulator [Emticicia sp. TH156]PLK43267.1 AraC family transcriptional regulator [Emticicia sp. TH156]